MTSYPNSLAASGQARSPANRSIRRAALGAALVAVLLATLVATVGRADALVIPSTVPVPAPDAATSQRPPVLDLVTLALLAERLPHARALVIDQLVDLDAVFDPQRGQPLPPLRAAWASTSLVDEAPPRHLERLPKPSRGPLGLLGGGVRPHPIDPPRVTFR